MCYQFYVFRLVNLMQRRGRERWEWHVNNDWYTLILILTDCLRCVDRWWRMRCFCFWKDIFIFFVPTVSSLLFSQVIYFFLNQFLPFNFEPIHDTEFRPTLSNTVLESVLWRRMYCDWKCSVASLAYAWLLQRRQLFSIIWPTELRIQAIEKTADAETESLVSEN